MSQPQETIQLQDIIDYYREKFVQANDEIATTQAMVRNRDLAIQSLQAEIHNLQQSCASLTEENKILLDKINPTIEG